MAPRSPRMSFEPTPALEENKENFSPLDQMYRNKSHHDEYFDTERRSRGVHFSDPPNTDVPRRSQSIATTTVPLLASVSSASQLPRQSMRGKAAAPEVDLDAYFEHSRSLVESVRQNHERDKKTFDEERKLWNTERSVLKARIADLEFKLNKSNNGKRRYSNDSTSTSAQVFRSDFGSFSNFTNPPARTASVPTTNGAPPVWEGPKQTAPVTRVFSNESDQANPPASHLTSISEDEASIFPELTQEISPTSIPKAESVPIDQIDSTLDGITLKSTAFAPSFVARVMTPTQTGSPARSPSPRPKQPKSHSQSPPSDGNGHNNLSLNMNSLLSPLDEKLKRHAGHTPMAFGGPAAFSSTTGSTEVPTPKEETPLAPAPSTRPPMRPSEDSDTYFSFSESSKAHEVAVPEEAVEVDEGESGWRTEPDNEDPELQAPLMLDSKNRSGSSNDFLDKVDAKLMEAAMVSRKDSVLSSSEKGESNGDSDASAKEAESQSQSQEEEGVGSAEAEKDFEMPKLRMKKSTNFGSAYGFSKPGNQW